MTRNTTLTFLIAVNAALLIAIVAWVWTPQAALAQATGLNANYIMVSGLVRNELDGLYVVDVKARIMHGFLFDKGTRRLEYTDSTDLERDFRNNRD